MNAPKLSREDAQTRFRRYAIAHGRLEQAVEMLDKLAEPGPREDPDAVGVAIGVQGEQELILKTLNHLARVLEIPEDRVQDEIQRHTRRMS